MQEQELRDLITVRLIPGFASLDDIEADLEDWSVDEDVDPSAAVDVARRMWQNRLDDQADWPDTGDYGQLSAAFEELEQAGILGRMNFTCCSRCAHREIEFERTADPDTSDGSWYGYREWAYVFFHEQDAERLADPMPRLYLGFNAFRPHPSLTDELLDAASDGDVDTERRIRTETETLVGRQIVDTLRRHGLDVRWSGDPGERIAVNIRAWRKPLPD